MFELIWALGFVLSFCACTYLKGRADARFDQNTGVTDNPPFIVGMLLSPLWPLEAIYGAGWLIYHVLYRKGRGDGLAINEELHTLRKFAGEYQTEFNRTLAFLQKNEIDPADVDDNTKRMLTARSIEWAMADDAHLKREKMESQDILYEILDRGGYPVPPAYASKGELEL